MINNLDELVSNGIHIVDFYAPWCGPCKMMGTILDEIKDIDIIKVNTDENKTLVLQNRIMNIPTIMIYKDGIKKDEIVGLISKEELLSKINDIKNED